MEIDELEVIAHLLLVLNLILRLHYLRLQRLVLQSQLLNQRVLRLLLILQILHQLFSIILSSAAIFGSGEETTEVKGLLTDLGNGQVSALQDGLKALKQSLGAVTTRFNAQFECFKLGIRNFVLLLRCELSL